MKFSLSKLFERLGNAKDKLDNALQEWERKSQLAKEKEFEKKKQKLKNLELDAKIALLQNKINKLSGKDNKKSSEPPDILAGFVSDRKSKDMRIGGF